MTEPKRKAETYTRLVSYANGWGDQIQAGVVFIERANHVIRIYPMKRDHQIGSTHLEIPLENTTEFIRLLQEMIQEMIERKE
jgi:hypothetical protein